jgi:hypothetical protein
MNEDTGRRFEFVYDRDIKDKKRRQLVEEYYKEVFSKPRLIRDQVRMAFIDRCVEDVTGSLDGLTEALNKASRSSAWIGIGLIAVGIGTVVMAALTYLK